MKSHKDLDVWKKSMSLVEDVYKITANFPANEMYGLTAQLKRASVSIPSNIAEGAARKGNKEFIQFLYISLGSAAEVETQILLAQRLGFSEVIEKPLKDIEEIKQMLNGLIRYLRSKN